MSKQVQRRQQFLKRSENEPLPEPVDIFSGIEDLLTRQHSSSEINLESLRPLEFPSHFDTATSRFIADNSLVVSIHKSPVEVPSISSGCNFKYSSPQGGEFNDYIGRMRRGNDVTIACVCEDGLLIGYGLAEHSSGQTEIEIIDVDCFSRRSAGLSSTVSIEQDHYTIGVGHVIVQALIHNCQLPIHTDSTTEHSRYIFKSRGFAPRDMTPNGNPCILSYTRRPEGLIGPEKGVRL